MINLKNLRSAGARPRVHGNGFIQIDLTETERLHIWGDTRIPRQRVYTGIHDHVFGFVSSIIIGRLLNVVYGYHGVDYGDYQVYVPETREGEDTILMPTSKQCRVFPIRAELVDANTSCRTYVMDPFIFHETFTTGPAATVITKTGPTVGQGATARPHVLCCVGLEPSNDFNRYAADEDLLWRITEEVLGHG